MSIAGSRVQLFIVTKWCTKVFLGKQLLRLKTNHLLETALEVARTFLQNFSNDTQK